MKIGLWWKGIGQSTNDKRYCSNCGWDSPFMAEAHPFFADDSKHRWLPPYCPMCGSRNKIQDVDGIGSLYAEVEKFKKELEEVKNDKRANDNEKTITIYEGE